MKKIIACVIICLFITLTACETYDRGVSPNATSNAASSVTSANSDETAENEVLNVISAFFADTGQEKGDWQTSYVLVLSYADLEDVYGYVSDTDTWYPFRYLNGGAYSDFLNNTYSEGCFEGGYLIAVLAMGSCSDWIFDCSASKIDDNITVNFNGTLGDSPLEDMGRFIYLVPVSGAYSGESISIVRDENYVSGAPLPQKPTGR